MPYPGLLHPEPLQQATADPYLHRRHSKEVWLSLCGVSRSWCPQGFVWTLRVFLAGMGLDSICNLILLPSFWGFSFAIGHGISPHSCSSGSRSWWWTGRPGVLQSMGWQRVGHDRVAELSWTINFFNSEAFWPKIWILIHSLFSPQVSCKI